MLAALLTALCWSASSIASARSASLLGGMVANRARLILASGFLALAVLAVGPGLWGPTAWWFVLSGVIGLGLGDIALFLAYERLGARVPALLTHCFGAPLGACIEWWWLGNGLHLPEVVGIALILVGVAIALLRRDGAQGLRFDLAGVGLGLLSAAGLAVSAVVSRQGYAAAIASGAPIPWLDAALLRNLGGLAAMAAVIPLWNWWRPEAPRVRPWKAAAPWLLLTALMGPGIGVACLQWALSSTKAGVVQAIVALVPVLVIPLVWWVDRERPHPRAVIGGLIAVGGVAVMALW